ncbi:hypothetical protein TcWFU_000209 [Taenia crassiceps]|uniref:Uncharacterized protein n=1 Tax=Taenia crassiceps TaxID=6207 RepID=A0ABR4Q6T5_9CEST
MADVEPYGMKQHRAVDELEMNHSNSSRCGCNRSFIGSSRAQGLSLGCHDNFGTWGQACPDPGRMANKSLPISPMKSTNDFSNETDIKKIAASCVRRYTLEESKALATSPSMYASDFCCPTQRSSDEKKSAASCPGEQMPCASKNLGQKVGGQAEFSRKPISPPKCGQNYQKVKYNESVTADLFDSRGGRGLQSSSICWSTKPQNDKCVGKSMEHFDDSIGFCNTDYLQFRSPTNMQRNPANRKTGRHSPCRIAITGCERPVVSSYCPPNISNLENNQQDDFNGKKSDHGVRGDMSKSTSRFLNAREDGGGSSQRLTGGNKMNKDCYHQSSYYPTSSPSKWNKTTAKDGSFCPHDSCDEDQESHYGADSCQKSSGVYSFQIKYTEVEEADSPSIPDESENDRFDKPNQLRVRDGNHQSPNKSLHTSACRASGNPQYASGKNLVEDYGCDEGEVDYQDCENIDGDNRAYLKNYYSTEPRAPQFLKDASRYGRVRSSRHAYEDPPSMMMQRYQQNHFMDVSRSPPRPQHRCMADNEHSSNWLGCMKDSECARCVSRAHSEECPSPYTVCKKTSGFRRKRSSKRCVSRRQKCLGRPRKVVRLSRRASMELERRYAPQVHRSESSQAFDAARNNKGCTTKRRYSQPESLFEDPIMSAENRKCLCRSSSSRCVMVNPCYRNNRAAFLRKKFNEARIEEEDDPCCCVTLFRSTPVRGNNRSPCHLSESVEEGEEGPSDCCIKREQEERDPCREIKTPRSRSPVSLNGCQPRENDTAVKKKPCTSNTPCLNIELEGKRFMVKKIDNTTNCASSQLMLPENACGKNAANNDVSIALGDKTIIIKNPCATGQFGFNSKCEKRPSDPRNQSESSCMDSVVSRHMSPSKQRRRNSPCKRRCGSAAVRKRSTPLNLCSLKETLSCESSAGIKPSICQPTVCVALDYVPDVQGPPSKAFINKCCSPTKRTQPKGSSGFCPCTQISNGAMPCCKRPTIINSPTGSFPQLSSPRTAPLRQWNAPSTRQPGSAANSDPRSKSLDGYNASSDGSQRSDHKPTGSSKMSEASGEPSKKTAPTQTSKDEESKGGDKVEKCTQCSKKMGFFARMCDKLKKKCAKASAQNQTDEEMNTDDYDGDDAAGGSNCMHVNDTTSCSLRYNETRSYNCSACSTSQCVSNQSHSLMDLTEDPTTNLQLTMRSCNNAASEPHLRSPAVEEHPITISRSWWKSEKMHCKTEQLQYRVDDYRTISCPTASDTSAKYYSVATQPHVSKYLCQEVNIGLTSYTELEIPTKEEANFDLNGPAKPPYRSTGYGNYPRGENYLTRFSKMPPAQCQQVCSSEVANTHNRLIEVTQLKSAVAPEENEKISKTWQGSEKTPIIKVPKAPLIPCVTNASPLCSVSNSFGFPTPHESISGQPINAVLQTPTNPVAPIYALPLCETDRFLPNSRIVRRSPPLHHRKSALTNDFKAKENADIEPSISLSQKKEEKNQSRYSFQVEGRRFHVRVDKEGVFHVQETVKPPENLSFVTKSGNLVNNSEKSRPATNSVNSEQSTREIQSQASPSAQLEPESSEKSVEVNEASNKCSMSRSKNSPIHEIIRRSIKSLSGKLTPKFSCRANQQVGNSHTMMEEEKKSGSEYDYFLPLTVSELPSQTESKSIASKIFPTNSLCNQIDHQAILDRCRESTHRDSSTHSQVPVRGVNVAVGSSYSDASLHKNMEKRVHSNKPLLYTYYSNYKSGDCIEETSSRADEGDCVVEDFDSYPQTKNSTLFNYACQSATDTSVGISASMSMGEQLQLQVAYMDTSAEPATIYHHFSLLDFSGEKDSTRPRVKTKKSAIRPNSAPLFLRKKTSSNHIFSNQGIPESALSNSDTDNIMETPFNNDYCELQEDKETQTQVELTNCNNSAWIECKISTRQFFYQKKPNFSNQNNCLNSCHEQMTHPQLTTSWSLRLLPPLNDSLDCGDGKIVASVGNRVDRANEKNIAMFPVWIDKDDTLPPRNDDNATGSINEKSCNSATENPSLMSPTFLLEGLCGTSGGTMDSCAPSTRSERRGNPKKKKRQNCMDENVWCASKPSSSGQNKSEGKRNMSIGHKCSKFRENKAFLLRKRQNCNRTSIRCVTCLREQQKQPLVEPEMHFFAKGVLKHPFRKARKDTRWAKDSIFKNSRCPHRPEVRKRRHDHVTKPSGDRCYASLTSRWRSPSRPRTRSHTSSCCNHLASFGIDTDELGPNTSAECYTFQSVEPLESIEQPSLDLARCKCNSSIHRNKLFRQCSDRSAAPRSESPNQHSRKHLASAPSSKSRSVIMMTDEEDGDWEVGNATRLSNPNFTLSRPHDTSHSPRALCHNSSSRPENLIGDCIANRQPLCLRMKNTLPIWNVKASTPPLLIVPSSGSQTDESPFVSSPTTSLNTSETKM